MKNALHRILQEPLLHFLLAACLLFMAGRWWGGASPEESTEDANVIVVDRAALLNFLQYRQQGFDQEAAEQRLAALDAQQRDRLAADFVLEEVLYREALRIGLEQGDYVIRQRLAEKTLALLDATVDEAAAPSEVALRDWFAGHADDYRGAASYDFTHIFLDGRTQGMETARARAEAMLPSLSPAAAEDAGTLGDPFPFLQDYAGRTRDFVYNNFGADFVTALDQLQPAADTWAGPLPSRYGQHLVLLRARTPAQEADFESVRARVLQDYMYAVMLRQREVAQQRLLQQYRVERVLP